METFSKDPNSKLDYSVDWTEYLGVLDIVTSAWNVPANLTLESESNTNKITTVVVSGGISRNTFNLTNTITYVKDGQTLTDDRTIRLFMVDM